MHHTYHMFGLYNVETNYCFAFVTYHHTGVYAFIFYTVWENNILLCTKTFLAISGHLLSTAEYFCVQ